MQQQRPNFVFIMTDSQGADDLGCYGASHVRTPRLDALSAEGIQFERAYTTCPICTPARAGIFSGQYPHLAGGWANEMPLMESVKHMGQRFQDAGYRTPYIGKWHLSGQDYFDTGICPDGFEDAYWYDGRRYLADLSDREIYLWRQGLSSVEALLETDVAPAFTWGHRISRKAIDFLADDARGEQPFCLMLSYDEPHGPCTCPAEYVERWKDFIYDPGPTKNEDVSDHPRSHRHLAETGRKNFGPDGKMRYPQFFACNEFIDREIGSVLDAVDRYVPENTWIIFTSDHGTFKGSHGGMCGKGLAMYDDSARIPLLVRPPGGQLYPSGLVSRTLASHIDILPTMLDLAGLEVPPILDGNSLLPQLRDGVEDTDKCVVVEGNRADADGNHILGFYPVRCLVYDGHKLVLNLLDERDELYDLGNDPHEQTNLIDSSGKAELRDRLHDRLIAWMDDRRDPFRCKGWAERPWHSSDVFDEHGGKGRPADGYYPPLLDYDTGKPK